MAARTGERCYWWCSQGLQVIQLHMVQNPTMYTIKLYYQLTHHTISMPYYLLYWRISEQLCCCWCGRQGCGDVEQEVASRGRHGGQKPTSNSDATNNNCQTIIFLVGDHFSERSLLLSACAFFIALCLWLICVDVESRKWTSDLKKLMVWDTFIELVLINSSGTSKNLLIEPLIS